MKIKYYFVLLIIVVTLVSCQAKKTEKADEDFRTGSNGLTINFLQNLPPARIYDEDEFNAAVEIANRGATEVGGVNDRVYLAGFDHSLITGITIYGQQIPMLDGKSAFNPKGTFDYLNFKGQLRDLSSKSIDSYPFDLIATACYDYKTIASANVCIDPDPFSPTAKQKICVPQNIGLGSQGAPVAVSKIDVEAAPGKTRFKIYVTNAGGGVAFKEGATYLAKCSPYDPKGLDSFSEVDHIQLKKVEVSGVSILSSCKPLDNNHIRLVNGQGFIICEFSSPRGAAAYATPLVIELGYGYRNSATKRVEIISSG